MTDKSEVSLGRREKRSKGQCKAFTVCGIGFGGRSESRGVVNMIKICSKRGKSLVFINCSFSASTLAIDAPKGRALVNCMTTRKDHVLFKRLIGHF